MANERCINLQQCTSIDIKGLFFLEFGLEGIACVGAVFV